MPILLLTDANLRFVKRLLRSRFRAVTSSHLTEALAASLGFRTHAALRAAIAEADPSRPPLAHVDPERLVSRLSDLGYAAGPMPDLAAIVRHPDLPQAAWAEYKNRDRAANARWFKDCERRDMPFICVLMRRKYAMLSWDCISIEPPGDAHTLMPGGAELTDVMFLRYQTQMAGDFGKSLFFGNAFVGTVDNLPPAHARNLADDFFSRLYGPMAREAAA